MHKSSPSWLKYKDNNYYNPILKIKSLIQNLDAELMQLCQQCAIPKGFPLQQQKGQQRIMSNSSQYDNSSPSFRAGMLQNYSPRMMIPIGDQSYGDQTRSLAGLYRTKVIEAYRNRKIFTVYGNYHTIRRALLQRGWLERMPANRYQKLQALPEDVLLQHAKKGNDFEAVAISKIINNFPPFFIWQSKAQKDAYSEGCPYRNRVRRSRSLDFSTKVGLVGCAENEAWYHEEGFGMRYPRFYRLSGRIDDRLAFIDDFRLTQCLCLIRYILENANKPEQIIDENGTIDIKIVNFALTHIRNYLQEKEHMSLDDVSKISVEDTTDWQPFLEDANKMINKRGKLKGSWKLLSGITKLGKEYLDRMVKARPEYAWDGVKNLWILKPGYQSRGLGIVIKNNLEEIVSFANNNATRRYIAQKYVERPLLIYNTKFDIRQYMMLVIGESKIAIWMYKDCYLRMSSQDFTIEDLRESIHLTNNSVQKKYRPKQNRDNHLPKCNMWSLEQFKNHLRATGEAENVWENVTYNGMKKILIAVVLASLESTDFVENSFELYGCDFMLDEKYQPILIEINSTPDLSPSTEVTARICPQALKDLVRVIVDLPQNNSLTTGNFEKIYEVDYKYKSERNSTQNLQVNGNSVTMHEDIQLPMNKMPKNYQRRPLTNSKKSPELTVQSLKRGPYLTQTTSKKVKPAVPKKNNSSNNKNPGKGIKLKSIDREALAMQYTLPN